MGVLIFFNLMKLKNIFRPMRGLSMQNLTLTKVSLKYNNSMLYLIGTKLSRMRDFR